MEREYELVVDTEAKRKEWIQLLQKCSDFHYDMSAQFDDEEVATVHRAWGRAIQDASYLVSTWSVEESAEVLVDPTPPVELATNVTEDINESTPDGESLTEDD
tara:strand:+ start:159 stop:467 length:309 start_codon:yes stop_codon:yes gene_type:complete